MTTLEIDIVRTFELYRAGHALRESRMRELGILLTRLHSQDHRQGDRSGNSFATHLRNLGIPRGTAYRSMAKAEPDYYENFVRVDKVDKPRQPRLTVKEWLQIGPQFFQDGAIVLDQDEDREAARRIIAGLNASLSTFAIVSSAEKREREITEITVEYAVH